MPSVSLIICSLDHLIAFYTRKYLVDLTRSIVVASSSAYVLPETNVMQSIFACNRPYFPL